MRKSTFYSCSIVITVILVVVVDNIFVEDEYEEHVKGDDVLKKNLPRIV